MQNVIGTCYLLHFNDKFSHAQHYVGWTSNLTRRINAHRKSQGSKLVAAVNAAGIDWIVARTWPNTTRHDERKLHNLHGAAPICPVCKLQKQIVASFTPDNDYWWLY